MLSKIALACVSIAATSPAFAAEMKKGVGPETLSAPTAAFPAAMTGLSVQAPEQPDQSREPQLGPGLELSRAVENGDLGALERLAPESGQARLVRLEDRTRRVQVAAVAGDKGAEGQRTLWADFFEGDRHPLRDALAERLGAPADADEAPRITKDSAQLTAYGMEGQAIRLHAGDGLLMTVHGAERSSIDKTMRLLAESGRYKSPGELLAFIVSDVISGYSATIDSLSEDFRAITAKLDRKSTDDSILEDAVQVGEKIDRLHETVQKQKRILQELAAINEFHASPHVPAASLSQQLMALDHHLAVLDHYQDRKNGLIDLYRAKISNDLDDAMKRLAAISVLVAPYAVVAGFMGMNVAIPGAAIPGMFWLLLGGATAISAAMLLWMKKKSWL